MYHAHVCKQIYVCICLLRCFPTVPNAPALEDLRNDLAKLKVEPQQSHTLGQVQTVVVQRTGWHSLLHIKRLW